MIIMNGSSVFDANGNELKVGEFIGKGGFGAVYKVSYIPNGELLALKTLTLPFSNGAELDIFLNEGSKALGIHHDNVIDYRYFHNGTKYPDLPPYILMEYANGGTLGEMLERARTTGQHFDLNELLSMMKSLVNGMDAINAILVHRDIKPDNILLIDGTLKIADFGLAKLANEATRALTFKGFGSFPYVAPEAWRMEENTIQLDIYSMGMVFYQLATLSHPFDVPANNSRAWMDAHLYQNPEPPSSRNTSIPPTLSQAILKMIAKDRSKRPATWTEVSRLLELINQSESVHANPIVRTMLNARIKADSMENERRLKEEKETEARNNFIRLVLTQAQSVIIEPLKAFFEEFNLSYDGDKISIISERSEGIQTSLTISLPDNKRIELIIRVLFDEDFTREVINKDDFGRRSTRQISCVPKLQNKRVQAFGMLKMFDGRGVNIILKERENEIYGEWVILVNEPTHLGSNAKQRPTPFAFELNEILKEFSLIGAMHIYHTRVLPFDMDYIQHFIASNI